jgi:hypothetical protein
MKLPPTTLQRTPPFNIDHTGTKAEVENSDVFNTVYLSRPAGRIAFSLVGEGQLVICIP